MTQPAASLPPAASPAVSPDASDGLPPGEELLPLIDVDVDEVCATGELDVVDILGAPLLLWERASTHTTELMREFALVQIGRDAGVTTRDVPARLLDLVADLQVRFAGLSDEQRQALDDLLAAGEVVGDFHYQVPHEVGAACRELRDLLDEADAYCADGSELMTLVAPPDQVAFRHWYLDEFVTQIAGSPPKPWTGPLD